MRRLLCSLLLLSPMLAVAASEGQVHLDKAPVNLSDQASLQRGAKWFMNYCAGCHSLQYARYKRTAKDIGITDHYGDVLTDLVKDNLIFTGAKIHDHILTAIPANDAKSWFGIVPPDLTLVARVRGSDWLYTYLRSFYKDDKRPWGSNNLLFPDVAMPNVLADLQGEYIPIYRSEVVPYNGTSKTIEVIDHLQLVQDGSLNQQHFDLVVGDIVNFLTYVGEPARLTRYWLGIKVIGFLLLFLVAAYLLKKEYWKDVK